MTDHAARLADLLRAYIRESQADHDLPDSLDARAMSRVTSILPDAFAAFDSTDIAYVWLTSPNATLNGFVPLKVLVRSDVDAVKVRRILRQIAPEGDA